MACILKINEQIIDPKTNLKPFQNQLKSNGKAMEKYIERRLQITQIAVFLNFVFYHGCERCQMERD